MNELTSIKKLVGFNPTRPLKKGMIAPFIEMAALPVGSRDIGEVAEKEFKGGGAKFQNGDTLFARITPCLENGKTAKVDVLSASSIGHGSTEFIVLAAIEPEFDEDYVYYLARHPEFRAYAQSRMEGTSGRQRVSWQSLSDFEFNFPDPATRKQAARALKAFDDKIQLNHQINQTLEQMAQAIFKSWFVDFEPVKAKIAALEAGGSEDDALLAAMQAISGRSLCDADASAAGATDQLAQMAAEQPEQYAELRATAALFPAAMQESELGEVPEGWVTGHLKDLAKYPSDRVSTEELTLDTYVSTECMIGNKKGVAPATSIPATTAVPSFKPNQVLVSNIRPYFKKIWLARYAGGRSPDVLCFDCIDNEGHEFLFNVLYQDSFFDYMMRTSKGVKMPRGDKKAVMEFELTIPSSQLISEYSQRITGFYKLAALKNAENTVLEQLRDTLLPKLLSGELTLAEAKDSLMEAAQ